MDEQERKARGRKAVETYLKNQEQKAAGPSRHYEKPEKEVEKACLKWMRERGWSVQIYESKATFNEKAGRFISQNMKAGTADCMGHLPDGIGVVVEFKAPGRLSSYAAEKNYRQQQFVEQKIAAGCFACVTDSVERLESMHKNWSELRKSPFSDMSALGSKKYLLDMLPKRTRPSKYDKDLDL